MPATYEYRYSVVGRYDFPIDMLRYDRATPRTSVDSDAITRVVKYPNSPCDVTVRLVSAAAPTEARWRSFLWTVTDVERTRV